MAFDNEALRDFVFTRLEKAEADSEWEPYISTGTQRNLNADKVKSFSLDIPSNEEASEISAYFANLDTLITLHQRKHDKLCAVKKSMLDKMFPKPGETKPEIRFDGFTDPWEQRKLGDIAPVTMGQSPNGACYTDNPNDAVLVQGNADLKDGWVFPIAPTGARTLMIRSPALAVFVISVVQTLSLIHI